MMAYSLNSLGTKKIISIIYNAKASRFFTSLTYPIAKARCEAPTLLLMVYDLYPNIVKTSRKLQGLNRRCHELL